MKTRKPIQAVVVAGVFLAGVGVGLVLAILAREDGAGARAGFRGPHEGQSGSLLRGLPPEDVELLLTFCRGYRRAPAFGLLVRSNAHAAEAMVRLRKGKSRFGSIVFSAYSGGDDRSLLVEAIEADSHRSAVVIIFEDDQRRLVHYAHAVDPPTHRSDSGCVGLGAIPAKPQSVADLGTQRDDGIVYVETGAFAEDRDKIRIPQGDVAVGLRYPDGSYSNFVPLRRGR